MKSKVGDEGFLVIVRRNVIEKLCFDDILFFESQGRKIHVHTGEDMVCFNGSLKKIKEMLDGRFCPCHGSFIVNLAKIAKLEGAAILLEGGKIIPVSQRKRSETARQFMAYFNKHFPCNPRGNIV